MSTAPSSTTARATKKSAFSCEPCRRRKVKCGGEQPVCGRCLARNDACVYKLWAPLFIPCRVILPYIIMSHITWSVLTLRKGTRPSPTPNVSRRE